MANEIALRHTATEQTAALHPFWRFAAWGGVAALALSAVAIATQTQTGSQRLALALAPAELPLHPVATVKVAPPAKPQDAEAERLAAKLRSLAADRERLSERVASLEHQIADMTGSIRRLAARPVPDPVPKKQLAPSAPAMAPPMISPLAMPVLEGPATWTRPAPQAPARPGNRDTAEAAARDADATETDATASAAPPMKDATAPAFENVPLPPLRSVSTCSTIACGVGFHSR